MGTVGARSPLASLECSLISDRKNIKMSLKMKDVLNVFRQNKMDKALGLLEHPTKYRSHNPILSASSESYSALGQRKSYQTSNFINAARTEDGTTFYMRQTFHN